MDFHRSDDLRHASSQRYGDYDLHYPWEIDAQGQLRTSFWGLDWRFKKKGFQDHKVVIDTLRIIERYLKSYSLTYSFLRLVECTSCSLEI